MEYLATMTIHVPGGTPGQAVDDVRAREAAHSRDLAREGQLLRLWRPPLQPGEWRSLGLFAVGDVGQLQQILASMPLKIWRTDQVTTLAPHPNDPGLSTRGRRRGGRGRTRANCLTRDTSSGCGHFRVRDALSACTGPGVARRWKPS
jgi:muconolactone delta-isomerase